MAISTQSIIHYTNTFSNLKSILRDGFKIKYCAETLNIGDSKGSQAAHPMVSFCDIPLSASTQHFKAYGKFGIGMSKKWAFEVGANPVVYIEKNSLFAKSIYELLKERRDRGSNLTPPQKYRILQIKSYAKNYSGPLNRKGNNIQNYIFYDEREWRLIPSKEKINNAPVSIKMSKYNVNKSKFNDKISNCRIAFDVRDISYLIVEKTSQIPTIIKFCRNNLADKCTAEELDILLSKICSSEQIIADY